MQKANTAKDSFLVRVLNERATWTDTQKTDASEFVTDDDLKGATSTIFTAGQDTVRKFYCE
jgi:hypothetical protein